MKSSQPYRNQLLSLVALTALGAISVAGCQKGGDDAQSGPQGKPATQTATAPPPVKAADEPPLIQAMQKADVAKARELIAGGTRVDVKGSRGKTALMIAAGDNDRASGGGFGGGGGQKTSFSDRDAMVQFLLSKHADPNASADDGTTPLLAAIAHHQSVSGPSDLPGTRAARLEKVKELIAAGAKVNVATRTETGDNLRAGVTPLIAAGINGDPDLVRLLIAKGGDVNAKDQAGNTALIEAARRGNADAVQVLITNHADVNARNAKGATPLSESTRMKTSGMAKSADLLRAAGAKG